jgi:CheY-like chemotaxis protein
MSVRVIEPRGAPRFGEPRQVVLVADDEPIVVEVVERYLRREGFRVVTAATADEAWRATLSAESPPDAIVLDIMLPGGDGMDIVRVNCKPFSRRNGRRPPSKGVGAPPIPEA